MDDRTRMSAFSVHRTTLLTIIPLAHFYGCIRCGHDLTDWVLKQSPDAPTACPNCAVRIDANNIAAAQQDTRLGCLRTLVGVVAFLLIGAAVVAISLAPKGP
jgi:DNA-directed RNA polymerase subunit RPC12/RpoP